jgi:hypothetical protein
MIRQVYAARPRGRWAAGSRREVDIFWPAAFLSLGVTLWLHELHWVGLLGADGWAGGLVRIVRDGLLTLSLAAVAVGVGLWGSHRSTTTAFSGPRLLARAALISLVFCLLLVPAAGLHQLLDRALDGAGQVHAFHGQSRPSGSATDLLALAPTGFREALFGYLAALPAALLGLALPTGTVRHGAAETGIRRPAGAAVPAGLIVAPALVLALLGAGLAALHLIGGRIELDHPAPSAHAAVVTNLAVGGSITSGDLRIDVASASWVWGTVPRAGEGERDQLRLEVGFENRGASPRTIGRGQFRLVGQDGTVRAPLAEELPAIRLAAGEKMATTLVFDAPPAAPQLVFASGSEPAETRLTIPDDPVGGLFRALCRVMKRPWRD